MNFYKFLYLFVYSKYKLFSNIGEQKHRFTNPESRRRKFTNFKSRKKHFTNSKVEDNI